MGGALVRGREALRHQAWGDAYARLAAADREGGLDAPDLEGAALAAYLTGKDAECEELWARAYRSRLDRGEQCRAARCAFWLGFPLLLKGEAARGGGWLARGARLLDEGGRDCAENGLLLVPVGLQALRAGNPAAALETFDRTAEIGQRSGDPDVLAFGLLGRGQALIALQDISAGVSLLDEAMVTVTADEVSPVTAGVVYCAVLLACHDTFDLARAEEWTAVLTRWCDSQQDLVPFRGDCLVHRAEVLQVRGDWPEALEEATRASSWLAGRAGEGRAHYRLGELHRLRGEYSDADRDYRAASAAGHQPQPGCALLRLAQGHVEAAEAMVDGALENAQDGVARAGLLSAYVEIALARRDVAAARWAADKLRELAGEHDASLLHAVAAQAHGTVLVAEGDARAGAALLQESCVRWQELSAPYEVGRTRLVIASAWRALGDDVSAGMELDAARGIFDRLGAVPDLQHVDRLCGRAEAASYAGLTARELEVLALVAGGRTNQQIASTLVISPHTVRRHLQNIFRKLDVPSRAAATAFALHHDLVDGGSVARTDHRPLS
jgi:DNA-binding CsgD family transcriptional regulator/tetratricopeptide (TPR) repeat protein